VRERETCHCTNLVPPPDEYSLLRCSLDVSVAVTDASVSEVSIFILLSLRGADWVVLASLWEAPTMGYIHVYMYMS
jgi:hypothetical protein